MDIVARKGIPHLTPGLTPKGNQRPSLTDEEYESLFEDGVMRLKSITEKTDGISWVIGFDQDGFYTMYSSIKQKMRRCMDFRTLELERVKKGKPYRTDLVTGLMLFHMFLDHNLQLQQYLNNQWIVYRQECVIKGEAFIKKLSKTQDNQICFNAVWYDAKHFTGDIGTFIMHTGLEENKFHSPDQICSFARDCINFDHDIAMNRDISISYNPREVVEDLLLLAKDYDVYNNRWGPNTEGFVFHTFNGERFKLVTPEFTQAKGMINYGR